jgi:hypothetical protein
VNYRFAPNIGSRGRIVRGAVAALLLITAGCVANRLPIVGIALLVGGAFMAFEALRGWCAARTCGIRTKL